MRDLMGEVRPEMEEPEFAAKFKRIDSDGSNVIEFDEFVIWVREDEIHISGGANEHRMTFEELAHHHLEPVALIKYLYSTFKGAMPEPEDDEDEDQYPNNPKPLAKEEVWGLVKML